MQQQQQRKCAGSEGVSPELKNVFDQLYLSLSEIGSLDFDVRQSLPRVAETKSVKHWTLLVNECLHCCLSGELYGFVTM